MTWRSRPGRRAIIAFAGSAVALLACLVPSNAAAIVPGPNGGCVKTAGGDPATTETEWTCNSKSISVGGYEVRQNTQGNSPQLLTMPKPNVTGSITHIEVDIVDGNSTPIPIDRLMLHHIVFLNGGRTDAACGGLGERFYGAGEERAKVTFPDGYGYPLNPSDPWFSVYMFMNHKATSDTGYIEYKMKVDPPTAGNKAVRSYWMDEGDCKVDPIYNVPGIDLPKVRSCESQAKAAVKIRKSKKTSKKSKRRAKNKAAKCLSAQKREQSAIPKQSFDRQVKDVTVQQSGRLLTGFGHVHGGAKALTISKPGCPGNPEIVRSDPTWGNADHPFYNVKPVLHEPGPIGMSSFSTSTGIPVVGGQTLRLNSIYDDLQPHTRVMGIEVLYLVPDASVGSDQICAGPPPDTVYSPGTNLAGRSDPVPFKVPLTGLDANRNAFEIEGPPGAMETLPSGSAVNVTDRAFSKGNITLQTGSTLSYNFLGREDHNITLANGPLGIGSDNQSRGTYQQTFTRDGTYKLFCGLHPVQMTQRVVVKDSLAEPAKKKPKKKRKKAKGKK